MTDLGEIFDELGLTQYLDSFLEQGFDTWDTILDITESDFDALGVKLGHRRKLQRKIANARGVSASQALASPKRSTPSEDRPSEESKGTTPKPEGKDGGTTGTGTGKRKYRRHPKPDDSAPERPPSAYVIFSNKMREDLRGRPLSFTEIAKLVGENWQNLSPAEKEPYEAQAFSAKEKYTLELAEYRQTESYKQYAEYLMEFKAKQNQADNAAEAANDPAKRPRLENHSSGGSGGSASTQRSSNGNGMNRESVPSRGRGPSVASLAPSWYTGESPQASNTGTENLSSNQGKGQESPGIAPPSNLPGYHDAIYGAMQQQQQQHTLAWRDSKRGADAPPPQFPRFTSVGDRRLSQSSILNGSELVNFAAGLQNHHRSSGGYTPPLLTSESTSSTNKSGASTNSSSNSMYYGPRTPLDTPRDRSLPNPSLFPSKPPGSFDTQLPPIRSSSLSPQSSMSMSYNSPSGILAMDYSSANLRTGYLSPSHQSHGSQPPPQPNRNVSLPDDAPLDPVSALIRAGEIVDNQNRRQPPPR